VIVKITQLLKMVWPRFWASYVHASLSSPNKEEPVSCQVNISYNTVWSGIRDCNERTPLQTVL